MRTPCAARLPQNRLPVPWLGEVAHKNLHTLKLYDLDTPVHEEWARHMTFRSLNLVLIVVLALLGEGLLEAKAQVPLAGDIGVFTAVEGQVSVTRSGADDALPAKLHDGVQFLDIIETERESRSKALLNDDSILTVGEHSRVEITEHLYDPRQNVRTVVVNLVRGKVRALVGKVFTGTGSKFEVHTPTSVAAARGTYFVVCFADGVSSIANIGLHGDVEFTSGGRRAMVSPGEFSVVPQGGGAPSQPVVMTGNNVPSQLADAVKETEIKDGLKEENPSKTALASGGTAPVPTVSSQTAPIAVSGSFPSVPTAVITGPTGIVVPAVISGAVSFSSSQSVSSPSLSPPLSPPPPPVVMPPPPVIHSDNGLHLGQQGLQPGHGGPIPGSDSGHHGNGH